MQNDILLYRLSQFVNYIFWVISSAIILRIFLKILGANPGAWFTDLVYGFSAVPLAPFQNVFGVTTIGAGVLEWSALLALIVYWFIAEALIMFLSMNRTIDPREADANLRAQEHNY